MALESPLHRPLCMRSRALIRSPLVVPASCSSPACKVKFLGPPCCCQRVTRSIAHQSQLMEGILHDQCSVIHLLTGLLNEAASRPCWHMHVNTFHSTHSSCGSNLACWTGTQKVGGHCVHAVECTWHRAQTAVPCLGSPAAAAPRRMGCRCWPHPRSCCQSCQRGSWPRGRAGVQGHHPCCQGCRGYWCQRALPWC